MRAGSGIPLQALVMVCKPFSVFIYLLALTGTIGNLTVLFAFTSHAIRHKALQPLDRGWMFSIVFQLPYLRYNAAAKRRANETAVCLTTGTCLSSPGSVIVKLTTSVSVGLDLLFINLIITLNGFIIDLLWRKRRKTRAASATGSTCDKHTAQATKILLSLLSIYVVCWLCNDIAWIALISGLLKRNFESSILRGLFYIYYSASSYGVMFGYKKVRQCHAEACWCLRCEKPTLVQRVEL